MLSQPRRGRLAATLAILSVALAPVYTRAAQPSAAEIDAAITKAVAYLYSTQNKDGSFEPAAAAAGNDPRNLGGYTALATYALLGAGEAPQDKRIIKAVDYLLKVPITGTYALGLRCQVWNLISESTGGVPVPNIKAARDKDGKALLLAVGGPNDPDAGLYDYGIPARIPPRHNSPAQYGVLGVWALEQIGFEVPEKYWDLVDHAWRKNQGQDGGWAYLPKITNDNPVKASMTAAGVATLFITNDYLHSSDGLNCKGNITNDNIEQGLQWMSRHFDKVGGDFYTLYGVERIGVASGYKYFGKTDWFAVGSETLVRSQAANGSWNGGWGVTPSTSFALLFLSRGRAPVAINKLDYETVPKGGPKRSAKADVNWNERPRDVANVVRWVGRKTENLLNWQVVNFSASPDDLHDAPILYISGDGTFIFSDDEISMLREFVRQGGMILGNAECGKPQFVAAFKKLGTALFPAYEWRELPENHVIYNDEQFKRSKWKSKPKVLGLSNGVREMLLLIPEADPARSWQSRNEKVKEELYDLGSDIILYSIDSQNLRSKGLSYIIKDQGVAATKTIIVGRIMLGDNPDPEPGGWPRLSNLLKNQDKLGVTVKNTKLEANSLAGMKLLHLTGTSTFKLSDDKRALLKTFVEKGGTLVIDAAGGSNEFNTAAEAELELIFGAPVVKKALAKALPSTHLLYNIPGHVISDVKYRKFLTTMKIGHLNGPHVQGIPIGDRIGVFLSREDLTAGMVGEQVDGIIGYDPNSATSIMRNIVLYAQADGKFKTPATGPTTRSTTKPVATSPTTSPAIATAPAATEPATAQPATSEPAATEPAATEPAAPPTTAPAAAQ